MAPVVRGCGLDDSVTRGPQLLLKDTDDSLAFGTRHRPQQLDGDILCQALVGGKRAAADPDAHLTHWLQRAVNFDNQPHHRTYHL